MRQTWAEFRLSKPEGSRGFKSASLHHSVPQFWQSSENRQKSARAQRFARDRGPGERCLETRFAGIQRKLSARDFGGSIRSRIASIGTERVWPARPDPRARNPGRHELADVERLFLRAPEQGKINPPDEFAAVNPIKTVHQRVA